MLKLTLMIALLGSMATAGDMGNGNSVCTVNCPPPLPPTAQQSSDETPTIADTLNTSTDIVIRVVRGTLDLLF